jgi:acetylornithine deacetylase
MVEQVAALLHQLVAFPSVSRTPNREVLGWLTERLESLGATVRVVEGAHAGRANLIATIGPRGAGGVLLSGHTDVVPPGDGWDSDPWSLTRRGDRLVGRGAADMKGFFAATIHALAELPETTLTAPVHLVASYDEEIGCQGVRDVLPDLARDPLVRPEIVVIGEPTMMRPRHSHLGKELHRLTVTAPEAHSSRAATAPSAITAAAELVGVLAEIQALAPAGADPAVPPYSLNCGTIRGGTAPNVIAGSCTVEFEVRHDTVHDPGVVLAPFVAAVARIDGRLRAVGGTATCERLSRYPALAVDAGAPAFVRAARLADAGLAIALGFGTEGGLIAEALDAPVMICGPGDIADAHRPNESVSTQQLERCVHFVRALIRDFCTMEGAATGAKSA